MSGLIVVGTTLLGGILGGSVGFVASLKYGSWQDYNLDPLLWSAAGLIIGGVVGAFVGGQLL